MRAALVLLAFGAACGGAAKPADAPTSQAAQPSHPPPRQEDPMRSLTKDECESLGNWIAEACQSRPHELSARVDGWCGDKMRGVSDGSWVPYDCVANVKLIDEVCFRGTNNVHSMMDCDRQVHRP